jgi:hypothetical protein
MRTMLAVAMLLNLFVVTGAGAQAGPTGSADPGGPKDDSLSETKGPDGRTIKRRWGEGGVPGGMVLRNHQQAPHPDSGPAPAPPRLPKAATSGREKAKENAPAPDR